LIRLLVAVVFVVLAFPAAALASAPATTFTFRATADARTKATSPSTNYGTLSYLSTNGYSANRMRTYLRFAVSGLDGPVASAKVRLHENCDWSTSNGPSIYSTSGSWSESTLTWNNQPAATSAAWFNIGAMPTCAWADFPVTPAVTANGTFNFMLDQSSTETHGNYTGSRETANFKPELVVTTNPPPPADTTPPSAPSNLQASAGDAKVSLSWGASSDNVGVSGYRVYRDGNQIASVGQGTLAYTDTGLSNGTTYSYTVRAFDAAGNLSNMSNTVTATPQAPVAKSYALRGMFFRQSNGGFDVFASKGFNLIDSDPSNVDGLTGSLKGLTWVGDYNRSTCQWEQSDATIQSYVQAHVGDPEVGVWFIGDEPWQGGTPHCASAPQQFKDRTALIHSIDPNAKTLVVLDGNSGQESIDQVPSWKDTADYVGMNAYMCWQGQACHFGWIDTIGQAFDAAGISNYWGVLQAFGDPAGQGQAMCVVEAGTEKCGQARMPTVDEIHTEFSHWRSTNMVDYLVFSWRWPDNDPSLWLENHPDIQDALAQENASGGTPPDTIAPAAPGGLTATAGDARVTLDWMDNSESDLNHYNVRRNGAVVASPTSSSYTDTGLTNGTTYTYTVTAVDNAGNESAPSNTATATPQGSATGDPVITAAGDICGTTTNCAPTSNLVLSIGPTAALTMGDNAYEDGTLAEYNSFYDPNWGRFKSITSPTTGNHDYHMSGAAGYFSYFGSRAPAAYYSYDVGSWHFIALASDSGVSPAAGGAEETWLKNDLATHSNQCTLAYWHEPRFSSGTVHGSSSEWGAVWQDLYNARADVVLNAHEHTYERFAPQNPSAQADPNGIVEVVAGTGGEGASYPFGSPLNNSVVRSGSNTFGVVKMTLHAGSYDLDFVPVPGQSFTDHYSGACH
jgi:chitodextrinase